MYKNNLIWTFEPNNVYIVLINTIDLIYEITLIIVKHKASPMTPPTKHIKI